MDADLLSSRINATYGTYMLNNLVSDEKTDEVKKKYEKFIKWSIPQIKCKNGKENKCKLWYSLSTGKKDKLRYIVEGPDTGVLFNVIGYLFLLHYLSDLNIAKGKAGTLKYKEVSETGKIDVDLLKRLNKDFVTFKKYHDAGKLGVEI